MNNILDVHLENNLANIFGLRTRLSFLEKLQKCIQHKIRHVNYPSSRLVCQVLVVASADHSQIVCNMGTCKI